MLGLQIYWNSMDAVATYLELISGSREDRLMSTLEL